MEVCLGLSCQNTSLFLLQTYRYKILRVIILCVLIFRGYKMRARNYVNCILLYTVTNVAIYTTIMINALKYLYYDTLCWNYYTIPVYAYLLYLSIVKIRILFQINTSTFDDMFIFVRYFYNILSGIYLKLNR